MSAENELLAVLRAFESHLAQTPDLNLPIAFENLEFTSPANGGAYVESNLMRANPDDAMLGSQTFIERGVYQITLCFPKGAASKDSYSKAKLLRDRFMRGTSLVNGGITVNLINVPTVRAGFIADGIWRVPLSVNWQAEVSMQ